MPLPWPQPRVSPGSHYLTVQTAARKRQDSLCVRKATKPGLYAWIAPRLSAKAMHFASTIRQGNDGARSPSKIHTESPRWHSLCVQSVVQSLACHATLGTYSSKAGSPQSNQTCWPQSMSARSTKDSCLKTAQWQRPDTLLHCFWSEAL